MGNIKANAVYNPDESRHPPPANTSEFGDRDSELEKFIRRKYEYGWFKAKPTLSVAESSPSRPRGRTQDGSLGLSPNRRHTELNDIVVPRRRSSPGPMEDAHRLSAHNTGASAGSSGSGPRARPKPSSPFMPAIESTTSGSSGNGNSGRRATKALVESSWADLLSLEQPSAEPSLPVRNSSRASSTQPPAAPPAPRASGSTPSASIPSAAVNSAQSSSPWPQQQAPPQYQQQTQAQMQYVQPMQQQAQYVQQPPAFATSSAMSMNGFSSQPMMVNPWMNQQPQQAYLSTGGQQHYAAFPMAQSAQPMMMMPQQQQSNGWYQAGAYPNGMAQGQFGQAYHAGTPNGWGYPS